MVVNMHVDASFSQVVRSSVRNVVVGRVWRSGPSESVNKQQVPHVTLLVTSGQPNFGDTIHFVVEL